MAPFETAATIPVEMKTADLGFLATCENLQFSIAYRIGLRKLVEQEGVLPPVRHILDIMVALWNKTKGGTDQCSRAIEDLHGKWENFLSPTSRITVRTLKTEDRILPSKKCILPSEGGERFTSRRNYYVPPALKKTFRRDHATEVCGPVFKLHGRLHVEYTLPQRHSKSVGAAHTYLRTERASEPRPCRDTI